MRDTFEVDLGPRKQRQTLAALLLETGRHLSVEELVYAVWDDGPPHSAVSSLRIYIHRLRAALAPFDPATTIRSRGGGYELTATGHDLDLADFERHLDAADLARTDDRLSDAVASTRAALALWRGDPLAGLPGAWMRGRRQRIENVRLAAVSALAGDLLRLGLPESVVPLAGTIVGQHPFNERARELLMTALHRCGRTAEALKVYRETRILFIEELGIEPGPALQFLHRTMLDSDAYAVAKK